MDQEAYQKTGNQVGIGCAVILAIGIIFYLAGLMIGERPDEDNEYHAKIFARIYIMKQYRVSEGEKVKVSSCTRNYGEWRLTGTVETYDARYWTLSIKWKKDKPYWRVVW